MSLPSKLLFFLTGIVFVSCLSAQSPIDDYDAAKSYTTGSLVLVGQDSYIATQEVPTSTSPPNTTYWTNLSVAATALSIPVDAVPTLSTDTILNSLPNAAPSDGNSNASSSSRFLGISTRGYVSSTSFLHAGIIINGSVDKTVVFMAKGPLLSDYGVAGALANPMIEIYNASGSKVYENDSWQSAGSSSISSHIGKTGISSPSSTAEAGLAVTLSPGAYTAVLKGSGGASGIALVEAYELSGEELNSSFLGISTRGMVTSTAFLHAGLAITGTESKKVAFMAKGPLLSSYGVSGVLSDPVLEIYNASGTKVYENDSYNSVTGDQLITTHSGSTGITMPSSTKEAAIVVTLSPGNYTAVLKGSGGSSGIALIEAYEVSN